MHFHLPKLIHTFFSSTFAVNFVKSKKEEQIGVQLTRFKLHSEIVLDASMLLMRLNIFKVQFGRPNRAFLYPTLHVCASGEQFLPCYKRQRKSIV